MKKIYVIKNKEIEATDLVEAKKLYTELYEPLKDSRTKEQIIDSIETKWTDLIKAVREANKIEVPEHFETQYGSRIDFIEKHWFYLSSIDIYNHLNINSISSENKKVDEGWISIWFKSHKIEIDYSNSFNDKFRELWNGLGLEFEYWDMSKKVNLSQFDKLDWNVFTEKIIALSTNGNNLDKWLEQKLINERRKIEEHFERIMEHTEKYLERTKEEFETEKKSMEFLKTFKDIENDNNNK